jgi:uncharacterized protein
MKRATLTSIPALLCSIVWLSCCAAQQSPVQLANVDPKIYEQYAGNYRLAKDRFVSLGALSENNDRPTFYDSKTRRVGVLYATSETEFVSGVMRDSEFLAGDVRVNFIKDAHGVVTGLTWREGMTPPISAPKVSPHRNEEVAFNNGDVALGGTLTLPATKGLHPAVVLLHGSGPARRPLGMWQYFLARHGIATLTYDKRGAGASTGDWQTASFEDLAGDALAAVQFLRNRPDINPRQIGLWGNSNSGWVVPITARSKDVAFVISRVGSALPPYENVLYEVENAARQSGLSEQDINQAVSLRRRYQQAIITNTGWEQLKAEVERTRNERWFNAARVGRVLTLQVPPDDTTLQGLRNPLVFDPLPFWERVTCPVLALFGELDMNVETTRSVPLLDAALKRAGNKDYTIVVLPKATHGLAEAVTDSSPEARLNRRYAAGYMDGIIDWLLKRLDVKK